MISLNLATLFANVFLAVSGALVTFGALNRMETGTCRAIRCAFATTCAGLLGAAISTLLPEHWQVSVDTLLYGGILALLVASGRRAGMIREQWVTPISFSITVSTWGLFLLGARA
jgi:uncharacterized membrane protein YeaQ/YmgE (transglycosylase-associated protein family)